MCTSSINKKIYVAYGSNLHTCQMSYRCPDAEVAGVGVLKNYKLSFEGWSGHGVATVTPCEGSIVPVVLWAISEDDERNLDIYEGFPNLYRKEDIEVTLANGSTVTGMVYLMNKKFHGQLMLPAQPTVAYFNTIASGYKTFGFDSRILGEAYKPFMKFCR